MSFRSLWNLLISTRFTITLLILISLVSIIGTILVQGEDASEHAAELYGNTVSHFLSQIGFLNIYHSLGFQLLIALLGINLLACTINRLPRDLKHISQLKKNTLCSRETLPNQIIKTVAEPSEQLSATVRSSLRAAHYAISESKQEETHTFIGQKGSLSRFGYHFVHIGLIIIGIGAFISDHFGYDGYMRLNVGESDHVFQDAKHGATELGFTVRHDAFRLQYLPMGRMISDYLCTLTILQDGVEQLTQTIEVNNPLQYNGFSFFQSSFYYDPEKVGFSVALDIPELKIENQQFHLKLNEPQHIPGLEDGATIKVATFIPNAVINEYGQIESVNDAPQFPAIKLEIITPPSISNRWSFLAMPSMDAHYRSGAKVKFLNMDFVTGLQIRKDPGSPVVWTGCGLLLLGLVMAFFFGHKLICVRLMNNTCIIGGVSHRNQTEFKNELDQLLTRFIAQTRTEKANPSKLEVNE